MAVDYTRVMQIMLSPELLLNAYAQGLFPMAPSRLSRSVEFILPEMRGQLSITDIHISKNLLKKLKQAPFEIRIDADFEGVIAACAQPRLYKHGGGDHDSWINPQIVQVFCELHARGHAHSVECWDGADLVGGLYGMKIGGVFFGESMFSRANDASKIALIHLCARLWKGGFEMLDTQFVNDHLKQFGVYEIPHAEYMKRLTPLLEKKADFILPEENQGQILMEYLQMRQFL